MEVNLQITVNGLPEELSMKIANAVGVTVQNFVERRFDLRRLNQVILTTDIGKTLTELEQKESISNPITYTNEEYAMVAGKVLILPLNQDYKMVLVFNAYVANSLLQYNEVDNQERFASAFHLLHHELCHIHDNNKILDSLPIPNYIGKDKYTYPLAWTCWAEYSANFMSASTASESQVKAIVESFKDAIKNSQSRVNQEILSYRFHGDVNKLMEAFSRHGEFLPKMAAYTLGYMDGLGKSLADLSTDAATTLSGSYFESIWNDMHIAFKEMYRKRNEGQMNLDMYNKLAITMDNYYNSMGFVLSTTKTDEIDIRIPLTPETTPLN